MLVLWVLVLYSLKFKKIGLFIPLLLHRSVNKHEKNYGILELKTLGLVWAVRYFRPYLLGHPCVAFTNHAACLYILNTAKPSGKLARLALTI